MNLKFVVPLLLLLLFAGGGVHAQQEQQQGEANEERLRLARAMYQIKPVKPFIDQFLDAVSQKLSAERRAAFRINAKQSLDYEQIEQQAVRNMAETFTIEELQVMVDFYGAEEAASIERKYPEHMKEMMEDLYGRIDEIILRTHTEP